jgi:hypothetical protein
MAWIMKSSLEVTSPVLVMISNYVETIEMNLILNEALVCVIIWS